MFRCFIASVSGNIPKFSYFTRTYARRKPNFLKFSIFSFSGLKIYFLFFEKFFLKKGGLHHIERRPLTLPSHVSLCSNKLIFTRLYRSNEHYTKQKTKVFQTKIHKTTKRHKNTFYLCLFCFAKNLASYYINTTYINITLNM